MRDRIFTNTSSTDSFTTSWWTNGSGYVYNSDYNYDSTVKYIAMRDIVTENFHKRMRAGEIILNPQYTVSCEKVQKAALLKGYITTDGGGIQLTGLRPTVYIPQYAELGYVPLSDVHHYLFDEEHWAIDTSTAVAKAWANVDVSEAAALASLGELPENVRWIISLLNRMVQTVRFFKSKRKRIQTMKSMSNASNVTDALSNMWLEFRYAVRPIAFEMEMALKALATEVEKGSRQTARGYDRDLNYDSVADSFTFNNGNTTGYYQYTMSSALNIRAGVLYDISNDINGMMSLWGLDQPLEAVWELTPFSFIIDWFFNVGEVISGWSSNASLRPLGSWVTVNMLHNQEISIHNTSGGTPNVSHYDVTTPGSFLSKAVLGCRVITPDRPVIPTFNLKLDTSKLLDLATIGRGLYRSFF